jgi:hypothetical protein
MGLRDAADIADIVREAMRQAKTRMPQVSALRFSRRTDVPAARSRRSGEPFCSAISCLQRCVRPECI